MRLHCKHCSETFEGSLSDSQLTNIDQVERHLEKCLADICERLGKHLAKEHPAQHALMAERIMQAVGLCTWLTLIGNHTMWLDTVDNSNTAGEDYIMEQVDANIDKVHELIGFSTYLADDEEELEDDDEELDDNEDDGEDDEETEDLEEIKG